MKDKGTFKICSLQFSIYFTFTGVMKIIHYIEDFVIIEVTLYYFTPRAGLSLRLHVAGYMQLVDREFEQLGSSSGSICLFCPMKVVGSHAYMSRGKSLAPTL